MNFCFFGKSRNVDEFEKIKSIGEGTYGKVYCAKDTKTSEIVALKKVKMDQENENGMPITSIREIHLLKQISHPNIVSLKDVAVLGKNPSSIFLVFEYCEHDMACLLDTMKKTFTESEVKRLMIQLLSSVDYLHSRYMIHRDIKLSNLLYNSKADFGLARKFGKNQDQLTPTVVTLWYRPIELLMGAKNYTTSIDLWAVGCIFGELLLKEPFFPGKNEMHQLQLIFDLLGYPNEKIWPDYKELPVKVKSPIESFSNLPHKFRKSCSDKGIDLLERMLTFDPKKRISAREALEHPYFKESPFPKDESLMPTFRSTNDKK